MAIRRRFASVPPVFVSAKTSRSRSFDALPVRSALHLRGAPISRADKLAYVSRADDYLSDRVTNAGYFSNYALEEGYDTARQSRNRDARLLRDATDAIQSPRSSASSSSSVLLGPRRFPRRFGKPNARKNKSSSFYATRLTREVEKSLASALPPSPVARTPSGDWRNYARPPRARSASVARSRFEDDVTLERPGFKVRAQSVGPSVFSPGPPSYLRRRSLPPAPLAAVAESRRLLGMPAYPDYSPFYEEYEPSARLLPARRRQKVLASRRPPGNYYDRLLRKRGKFQGRQKADVPGSSSLIGSNLTGALSRVGRANEYSGASLLLSIEGSGLSTEGKRVGFTYTPPPIRLYGSTLGVDESILRSRVNLQPLDTFLSGHVSRMQALKMQLDDNMDRIKAQRRERALRPLEMEPMPVVTHIPATIPRLPYLDRPLMTTIMRQQAGGQTQRLDLIPLGDIKPHLSRAAARSIALPQNLAGGLSLSMLDKINIKAAIIASKMEVDSFRGRRPRSEYAARKYRAMRMADQENIYAKTPLTAGYYASHPPLYVKPKVLSKVVVRRPGSWTEQVVTIPYQTAKKKSRFLGKPVTPVKYFPSPYDFPDPRLNVPPRGTVSSAPRQSTKDGAEGGAPERQRATVKIPNYYAYGVDPANPPVSDLRRRIRKTLNKTRRS